METIIFSHSGLSILTEDSKRVLIVEDELILSLVMERMVKKMGHHVIAKVATGEEAVALGKDMQPDIILMDIQLKGTIDGIDAAEEIRQCTDSAVIFITGNTDSGYRGRAEKTSPLAFLTKPVSPKELSNSFSQVG